MLSHSTLAAWLHTIDPYFVQLWPGGPVRWYGVSYLVGFFLGFLLIRRVCRVGRSTLDPRRAADLVIAVALGAMIGGRLGYAAFYRPELFTMVTDGFPWWGVLDMLHGGMSSHGGMIGAVAGGAWFAWRHKQHALYMIDLLAFGAPLGLACGRLANFINGELLGRACEPGFPLAVQFPQELLERPELLARFDAALGASAPADALERIQAGSATLSAAAAQVLPTRHPSQLYAASLEGLAVMAVLLMVWAKPRRAGTVAGAFGLAYAAARIGGEYWRLPDAYLPEQWLGLSRGQWLSLPVAAAGLGLILFAAATKTPVVGGWRVVDRCPNRGKPRSVPTIP